MLIIISAFVGLKRFPKALAIFAVILLFLPLSSLTAGAVSHSGTLVYEKETLYSHLDVSDSGNIRTLYLNGLPHSAMYKDDPNELVFTYTKYFHLGFAFNDDVKNVLFVGGGGFSGPKNFLETYPDVRIDVVEIDPDVIDVAKKYFSLDSDNSRIRIFNGDARSFLSSTDQRYDLIVLDAFSKSYVPFHLMTVEYFEILDERLAQDGVIVSNLIGTLSGDTSDLLRAVYKTMAQVFPMLHVFTTRDFGSGQVQNILIVAARTDVPYNEPQLVAMLDEGSANMPDNNGGNTIDFADQLVDEDVMTTDVPVLTDQHAPAEQLLNPLTGRPYTVDEQIDTEQGNLPWTERGSTVFILLGLIVIVWIWQFREIWKGKEQEIRSQ
jgi:spermidine synthase